MENMHLAQLNIATASFPLDSPELAEFVDNLEPINQLAERSPGYVWRLQDETGNATSIQAFDDPNMIVNMSVWESPDQLKDFMFRTHHRDFLRRRKEWFQVVREDTYVLWWIPVGHVPTIEEAVGRLEYLREHGDTPHAFTFKSNFQPEEVLASTGGDHD